MTNSVLIDVPISAGGWKKTVEDTFEPRALHEGFYQRRAVSVDARYFAITKLGDGVTAYSRISTDEEVVLVANSDAHDFSVVYVIVDDDLNKPGDRFRLIYSNREKPVPPGFVVLLQSGAMLVESDGKAWMGPLMCFRVTLGPEEVQILVRQGVGSR